MLRRDLLQDRGGLVGVGEVGGIERALEGEGRCVARDPITVWPSALSRSAIARPMPRLTPVTR